ncbi:Bacterial capsule synthesis protein PGA_cap [Neomoorella glycerini]|uniref:Bacterial capsule synthesis protein PGA_cap n=1 Tax=Neomoorella glycerini TaxID=55779 RepID=A0A6I5ZT58_9FIRM|nr:CapA family protein [Moorella glycerini]QGP92785.1 Bacterial capsule synthesis protein PGA_cap [Moorella glycerini]
MGSKKWVLATIFFILMTIVPFYFGLHFGLSPGLQPRQPGRATEETPTTASQPPPPPPPGPLTLAAVGDVMLARKVDRLMQAQGLAYPLAKLGPTLRNADLTFSNLEAPLATTGKQIPGKGIWFRARPEAIQVLKDGGFDVMNIANNHILDYDTPAFLQTMDLLKEAGIRYFGGGRDLDQAREPAMVEVNGVRLGFLGYSDMADIYWSHKYPRRFRATATQAGVAPLVVNNAYLVDDICQDIQKLKPRVDLVIVSLHWGTEYQRTPAAEQRQIAHRLVEAGAGIILGHHPHVFQGLEIYEDSLIAYSLGNFIMDQNWSRETCQGLLLKIKVAKEGWQQAEILPVQIVEEQPRQAEGKDAATILSEVRDLSQKLGTGVEVKEGKAMLNR